MKTINCNILSRTYKFLLLLSLMLITGFSQINSQWISNYYGNYGGDIPLTNAHGTSVCTDNFGNCYITGYVDEGSGNNILVIKYNSETGDTLWVKTFDGPARGDDRGNSIITDNEGNIYVTGKETATGTGEDLLLLKYSTDGTLLFHSSKPGFETDASDIGVNLTLDMNGNIYVTGYCTDPEQIKHIFTVKFNSNGDVVWQKFEQGDLNTGAEGTNIAVNRAGSKIYVIGYITSTTTGNDMVFIEYTLGGAKSYTRYFDGGLNSLDRAFGIAVDESDNIYITGYSTTAATGTEDFILLKYNSSGDPVWQRPLNGEGNQSDRAFGIAVDEDGFIYITGQSTNLAGNNDYLTAAFDPEGNIIWQKVYDGIANNDDEASAIGIITNSDNTKSIIVTGSSWGVNENNDYVTVRYEKNTGNLQSVTSYSMNAYTEDIANDLAVSDNSEVFITGFSQLLGGDASMNSVVSTQKIGRFEGRGLIVQNNVPSSLTLYQNYPNPFNPSTIIKFTLGEQSKTKLTVYDIMGREVTILVNENLKPGTYSITYTTQALSSGIYFYEIMAGAKREVKKMTFIK